MITVKYRGGLGNNMFQRSVAEIFARTKDLYVNDSSAPRQLKEIIRSSNGTSSLDATFAINDNLLYGQTNYLKHLFDNNKRLHFDGFFSALMVVFGSQRDVKVVL